MDFMCTHPETSASFQSSFSALYYLTLNNVLNLSLVFDFMLT